MFLQFFLVRCFCVKFGHWYLLLCTIQCSYYILFFCWPIHCCVTLAIVVAFEMPVKCSIYISIHPSIYLCAPLCQNGIVRLDMSSLVTRKQCTTEVDGASVCSCKHLQVSRVSTQVSSRYKRVANKLQVPKQPYEFESLDSIPHHCQLAAYVTANYERRSSFSAHMHDCISSLSYDFRSCYRIFYYFAIMTLCLLDIGYGGVSTGLGEMIFSSAMARFDRLHSLHHVHDFLFAFYRNYGHWAWPTSRY